MKQTTISVTEAARNFAECVNLVRYQNVSFVLLRNGSPAARLVPAEEKQGRGADLARALSRTGLPAAEASAWHRDLGEARRSTGTPASKWK